ncbi:hypothetical protein RB598_009123 [Gaeumannomyces tritici]
MDAFVKRLSPSTLAGGARASKRPKTDVPNHAVGNDEETPRESGDDRARPSSRPKAYTDVEADTEASELGLGPDVDDFNTPFESALPPPFEAGQDAVDTYETASGTEGALLEDTLSARLEARNWVKGRSSIYVDAFNLALETVLSDEACLFDAKETAVFDAWRALDYGSQYLYVRLFLRKTAAWHRSGSLASYSDVVDPAAAVQSLQECRKLPTGVPLDCPDTPACIEPERDALGDTFAFADSSSDFVATVEEALSLLNLDELKVLAKECKVQGRNKAELQKALCRASSRQVSLASVGLRRTNTGGSTPDVAESPESQDRESGNLSHRARLLGNILAITGPCIRLSPLVFKLFERVHLVFYRSTEWTEKSLTTIILAKMSRRNFPEYIVCRSANIFTSRRMLLEFEQAVRTQFEVDKMLESGPPGEAGFREVVRLFNGVAPRWRELLREEQVKEDQVYDAGEGCYLRRFNAAHAFTRIAHKTAYAYGRLHEYKEEHALLTELLDQRLFHMARRGSWYQRKALLEERYMVEAEDPSLVAGAKLEQERKRWRRIAVATCETALEDRDCHLIFHYDLQKRLVKLERRLKVPRRLQHDFGHVRLRAPEEHTIEGIQVIRDQEAGPGKLGRGQSTKTIWIDEHEDGAECSVEEMCLSHYRKQGWKGYHAEGGILRTIFAYLFYDILFLYIPNVFQTAYQACPLDLHTDAFYAARASEINHRLVEIGNGGAAAILRRVHERERERRTCVVGLNWDFALEDLAELVGSFGGEALAAVCKVMAQEYRQRGSGMPDLLLWRAGEVMFAEVKSANDRLSDAQRLWVHVLTAAGVRVVLALATAREARNCAAAAAAAPG